MNIIEVKNLNFKYNQNQIFKDFNLEIKESTFTTLIGLNGSGKSTLIKIISGILDFEGNIKIDNVPLNNENLNEIRKKIGIVFENYDNKFNHKKVIDNIAENIENTKDRKKKIKELAEYLNITHLIGKNIHDLNESEKGLVMLAKSLVNRPKILILDEAFNRVNDKDKKMVYEKLKELNKQGMTIINITHDMDDILYGNDVILIDNGNIILKGPKEEVLLEEKVFNKLNLELPFMASLSIKLKYYGLVDRLIFDMNEMVNEIWK